MRDDELAVSHVMLTADAVGGVWTYALELATQLGKAGIRTTVVTMGQWLREPQREAARRVAGLRVIESAFKLEWMEDPWRDVSLAGDWLLALEERERPDVVHLNGYAHACLEFRAPKLLTAHSCVLSWWKAVLGEQAPRKYARYRREVSRGLASAGAVVAPTRAMLVSLREFYGEPQRGIVIANGVDGGSGPGACRKEPFVLAAGRLWDQAKNLATLARAARRVRWPVYVAGSEEHPTGGDGTRQALNGLRTLGWLDLDELHRWMQRAAIYALPARYEPFGLSVLEAALRGCALVLGDIPSLREVWGDAAVYVPPDDADRLVDRLEQLAGDDSMRARMAQAAYDRACFFSAERMGRDYIRLYRELVVRRLPGASASTIWPRSSGDAGGSVESCK